MYSRRFHSCLQECQILEEDKAIFDVLIAPFSFELPVYVEPLARAFAENSLDDVDMTEGVADTGVSQYLDLEAAESSRTHSSSSFSRTSSSTHEDSSDDSS